MATVTQAYLDILASKGVTGYQYKPSSTGAATEKLLTVGLSVISGYIILKANTGYTIVSATYRDDYGFVNNYTVSSDGLRATCDSIDYFMDGFTLETKQLTPNVQGVNQVYELDEKGVSLISSKQFDFFTGQTTLKYGDYLLGLIKLPFTIPNDLIVNPTAVIKLGDYNTGVTGKLINSEKLEINVGNINVPLKFNNSLDFINTTCILYLPYCDPINLENEYVIGQVISIQYIVNLYNGEMVVNITSSKNNEIIVSKNIDLDIEVPFANVKTRPPKNDSRDIKLGKDNGLRNAHIVIMRNNAILPFGFFTIPITDEKPLQGETGFVKIDNIELRLNAPDNEKDSIISLLNNGVIIK